MALRKKKKPTTADEAETESEAPSILDRLTELRYDIEGKSAVTELLDILIDANGGDSAEIAADIAAGHMSDASRVDGFVDEPTGTTTTEGDE